MSEPNAFFAAVSKCISKDLVTFEGVDDCQSVTLFTKVTITDNTLVKYPSAFGK